MSPITMFKCLYLFIVAVFIVAALQGCGSLGSNNVDGEEMLRVQETGVKAGAGYPVIGDATGDIGGCRVEKTGELPEGMIFEYDGERCRVEIRR